MIEELAAGGYEGIEIGAAAPHGYPDFLDQARRTELRSRLAERNVEVSALCPAFGGGPGFNPVSPEEAERRASRDCMAACIELASDLDCRRLIADAGVDAGVMIDTYHASTATTISATWSRRPAPGSTTSTSPTRAATPPGPIATSAPSSPRFAAAGTTASPELLAPPRRTSA